MCRIAGPTQRIVDDRGALQRLDHRIVGTMDIAYSDDAINIIELPFFSRCRQRECRQADQYHEVRFQCFDHYVRRSYADYTFSSNIALC